MASGLPPLSCLVAFETVARRLSFITAARELHLTPSAISHQVAKLEEFLGVRLLHRSARKVELTIAGEDYLKRVGGALAAIGAATELTRKGVRDTLHVHATPSFATLWLMPRLRDFSEANPGVSLSLSSSVEHSDFSAGLVDLDIRYGLPNWPQLVVQPIFEERIEPLACPEFIERHAIRTPDDLLHVPLIQSTVSVVQWADWFATRDVTFLPTNFAYRFDRAFMALSAAIQGLGVALESTTIAEPHLRDGKLYPLFPGLDWHVPVQAHFLVYPAKHEPRAPLRNFVAWLRARSSDFKMPPPATGRPQR